MSLLLNLNFSNTVKNYQKKPRWLVFNKIDTMSDEEAEERVREITEQLGWEEDYYLISAATGKNVPPLCRDIMDFIIANPREAETQQVAPEEVKFKWKIIIRNN